MVLAVMASLIPPAALVPVHGVIQLGSNVTRAGMFFSHIYWMPVLGFSLGSLMGASIGGRLVVTLPSGYILIGVGLFVIWNVLAKPPKWLSKSALPTGAISSFLTMFFGATGVFVANFSKSLQMPKDVHVGTHAAFMSVQHGLKILIFALLGFEFGPWLGLILSMIATGVLGTYVGRRVLIRISDAAFKKTLDILLTLIALRLIYQGLISFS